MYMDETNEKESETLIKIVKICGQYIGIEFGIEKMWHDSNEK